MPSRRDRDRDHHGHIITMAFLKVGLVLLLLASTCIISIDGAAMVVINNSGRTLDADCGEFRGMIYPGERVTVRAAADQDLDDDDGGSQGGEGGIMMYTDRYLLDWNTETRFKSANGALEHEDCDRDDRRRPWQPTCRVEAGNCFLAWDLLLHGHGQQQGDDDPMLGAEFEDMLDDIFDRVWNIDEAGVTMRHAGMHYSSMARAPAIAGSTSVSPIGDEYQSVWRKSNRLFPSAAHCLCATRSSSFLVRAFYTLVLYFTCTS